MVGRVGGRSLQFLVPAYWNDLLPNISSLKSGSTSMPLSFELSDMVQKEKNHIVIPLRRMGRLLETKKKPKRKTKNDISTSDTATIKGEAHSNNRGRNDRSKRQRQVASNRQGSKLDYSHRIEVYRSSSGYRVGYFGPWYVPILFFCT